MYIVLLSDQPLRDTVGMSMDCDVLSSSRWPFRVWTDRHYRALRSVCHAVGLVFAVHYFSLSWW